MTIRAILLGFLGVFLLCAVTYFNNNILNQTHLVGNHLPLAVYGGLLLFLLLLNPILARFGEKAPLRGKELVLILGMMLVASTIPGSGLMRTFTAVLMLPHHHEKSELGWRTHGVVDMAPEGLLADPGEDGAALNNFVQGMGRGDRSVSFGEIPWEAWSSALIFWVPLIFAMYLLMLGVALVVHRQWSAHEQLPYPLAQFANSLLPVSPGKARGPVFENRLFWLGLGIVLVIHLNNYATVWFPGLVKIPLIFSFTSLFEGLPEVRAEGIGAYQFRLYFSMVAIGYFLAADVGLAIGLAPMIYPFIGAFFTAQGVSLKGGGHQAPERLVVAGAFFGIFLTLLYTGRHYYQAVFRRALGLGGKETMGPEAVWGARLLLGAAAWFTIGLCVAGLDWWLALLLTFIFVVFYTVMGRIIAETGLFFIQPWWLPAAVVVGLLGAQALGPEAVLLLFLVSVILLIDPREAVMPFIVTALKLLDMRKMPLGSSSAALAGALALGLAVAIPVTLYFQYNNGATMTDGWATKAAPSIPFAETMKVTQRLSAQGTLEAAQTAGTWERITSVQADPVLLISFATGLGLTLLFNAGRLRFAKWPLHPIFFIVFCSYAGYMVAFSFLLGWAIKLTVTKYGGEHGYHGLKPLMFGLIGGDLLGGLIPILIGWIYYLNTGVLPKAFSILPT